MDALLFINIHQLFVRVQYSSNMCYDTFIRFGFIRSRYSCCLVRFYRNTLCNVCETM